MRFLATLLVYGPTLAFLSTFFLMARNFSLEVVRTDNAGAGPLILDVHTMMALATAGCLSFVFGVIGHWVISRWSGSFPRWAWRAIFANSVLACFIYGFVGVAIGVVMICVLYSDPTFAVRSRVVPSDAPDSR
jgi:hypothetical protein